MRKLMLAAAVASVATPAFADPIVGSWSLPDGAIVQVAPCGQAFCFTLTNGDFAGSQIGRVSPDGERYVGELTDPTEDRTYRGTAVISGDRLEVEGCALRVFCRSQTWRKM